MMWLITISQSEWNENFNYKKIQASKFGHIAANAHQKNATYKLPLNND
jgi:hypothetical protein